jgi:hypothetical protein
MKRSIVMALLGLTAFATTGCGTIVRYRTATHFAQPPAGKITYYATYLEGTCGGLSGGCTNTNSKIRRCTINDDNTMTCVDDAEGNKALNKDTIN